MIKKSIEKTPLRQRFDGHLYKSFSQVRSRFRRNLLSLNNTIHPRNLTRVSRSKLMKTLHHKKLQLAEQSCQNITLMTRSSCLRRRVLRTPQRTVECSQSPTPDLLAPLTDEMTRLQRNVERKQRQLDRVAGELKAVDYKKMQKCVTRMHYKVKTAERKCRRWQGVSDEVRTEEVGDGELGEEEECVKENRNLQLGIKEQESYHCSLQRKIAAENSRISVNLNEKLRLRQKLQTLLGSRQL